MPTLDWIGKDKVVNHHLDVHYHVLDKQYSFGSDESENMIIHGDNLTALKSLLPKYEGRIDCIYIDPPYNTGNEGWVYNDKVNDPTIIKWLGQVVGSESEDLSRHDKWLCMMYPRLRLLHKLLSDNGAIFISIDENEVASLRMICDEIFGKNCFVANVSWQKVYSPKNNNVGFSSEVEYILCYSKHADWIANKLERTEKMNSMYKNPDNDPEGDWTSSDATAPGASTHQGMVYAIQSPFTGEMLYPTRGCCWRRYQDDLLDIMNGWAKYKLEDIGDNEKRAEVCGIAAGDVRENVKSIILDEPLEAAKEKAEKTIKDGVWPLFYFTKSGQGGLRKKTYLKDMEGRTVTNFWPYTEVGHNDEAKKELGEIFDGKIPFDTPKPTRLIERIIRIATNEDSIVLDSFAGSGTTGQAVLNYNSQNGGNRKFIMVELGDYAESITAERAKRVIKGYGKGKKATEGLGGDFSFYELGEPIVLDDRINPSVSIETVKEFVYYLETKKEYKKDSNEKALLGVNAGCAYYFFYEPGKTVTLNRRKLSCIKTKAESYVIYADQCTLSDDELKKYSITFKKPGDIGRI